MTFGDTVEGSNRKRRDQHIIRHLKKELEKAKSNHFTARNTGPKKKKSQVRVARYGRRIEACRGEISPIGARIA